MVGMVEEQSNGDAKMIRQSGSSKLSSPSGGPCFATTKGNIQKIKHRLCRRKRVSIRKLSMDLRISERSVRRIMKNDVGLCPYKKVIEPLLSNDQKVKQKKFANWVRTNFFRKGDTMRRILFSDEKFFGIDGVYNYQNDRVWPVQKVALSRDENSHRK